MFTPIPGEMIQFDEHIFQMGGSTTNQFFPKTSENNFMFFVHRKFTKAMWTTAPSNII